MMPFELAEPRTLPAAIDLLDAEDPEDPAHLRGHRADADDEGRGVSARPAW